MSRTARRCCWESNESSGSWTNAVTSNMKIPLPWIIIYGKDAREWIQNQVKNKQVHWLNFDSFHALTFPNTSLVFNAISCSGMKKSNGAPFFARYWFPSHAHSSSRKSISRPAGLLRERTTSDYAANHEKGVSGQYVRSIWLRITIHRRLKWTRT